MQKDTKTEIDANDRMVIDQITEAATGNGACMEDDFSATASALTRLEDLLFEAWALMSHSQREDLLASPAVRATGVDPANLTEQLQSRMHKAFYLLKGEGYEFDQNDFGYFWATEKTGSDDRSREFISLVDAVDDAYKDLLAHRQEQALKDLKDSKARPKG